MVDTSNEWIVQRTGIRERRIAVDGESTITFALKASQQALEDASMDPKDLDMIIVGTQTPDMVLPSTACLLQGELGAPDARAFDLKAGCTGWLYSLVVADNFIKCNPDFKVLVVGAELLSRTIDWEDRAPACCSETAPGQRGHRKYGRSRSFVHLPAGQRRRMGRPDHGRRRHHASAVP